MATFFEHIRQAKENLAFLIKINSRLDPHHWDWEVIAGYYVAVHMINAHLAKVGNLHYTTHAETKDAINPHNRLSRGKLPEDIYLCYLKLEGLSRRARYLCHEDRRNRDTSQHFTYDKHFARATKRLDMLINYFKSRYEIEMGEPLVSCKLLDSKSQLKFFKVSGSASN